MATIRVKITVVITSLLLSAACGKAPEASNASNVVSHAANTAAANTADIPPMNIQNPGANSTAVNGALKPPTETGAAPKSYQLGDKDGPAPDDSDIKSALGENFVQTRTFHSNPQIAKVENITVVGAEPKTTTKVYLKNGQVKQIDLKNALTAPAADILKAIH